MSVKIDKSFTKKDLLEFIDLYEMDIDDSFNLPKSSLQTEIISYLKYNDIKKNEEYPDILTSEDLLSYLVLPKPNVGLNYKEKQEMIHTAKKLIQYCKNSYLLSLTDYNSIDEIYQDGLKVSKHCDIPTCRRAINFLNEDNKIRNKFDLHISKKVQQHLEIREKQKQELTPTFKLHKGFYQVKFD
jgi:hypothetical protein